MFRPTGSIGLRFCAERLKREKVAAPPNAPAPMAATGGLADESDGSHHRPLGAKAQCSLMDRECLLMAISGLFVGVSGTSAYMRRLLSRWF